MFIITMAVGALDGEEDMALDVVALVNGCVVGNSKVKTSTNSKNKVEASGLNQEDKLLGIVERITNLSCDRHAMFKPCDVQTSLRR